MSRSRLLTVSALLPAALLATAACSPGPAAEPWSAAPAAEVARTTVSAPGTVPAGDRTDARGVSAGPDGTTLVVLAGDDTADGTAPGAALAVVGPDGTTVQATAELAPGSRPDTAFGSGGAAVVAGPVWPGAGPVGYALQVVDPATGTVTATLPVAVPGDALLTGSAAALGPDGVLYVAVSRSAGPPLLLAVDPATGAVRASADVDLAVDGVEPTSAEVGAVAVSPDGSRVVLAATTPGPDTGAPARSLLLPLTPDLLPRSAPVDLTPGFVRTGVQDLVVVDDGTVYAVVRGADADGADREHVVTVGVGATEPTVLTADGAFRGTPVTDAEFDGTALWLTLQQESAAASVVVVDLVTGAVGTPLGLCDELAGYLHAGDDGRIAVTARCDGEAVLWWLDPR
ncbi:hypothetical protein [Geodermatophilus arenarius]|uniref:Lactonase, 7-bladed beta-propeller n=1 Tax=Geodermatophilus arenarius TaxID=1137990 RepID=A0ABV9LIV1_9ACTN